MRRELKGLHLQLPYRFGPGQVAEHFPMKELKVVTAALLVGLGQRRRHFPMRRELKVARIFSASVCSAGRRTFPDEEGTERPVTGSGVQKSPASQNISR